MPIDRQNQLQRHSTLNYEPDDNTHDLVAKKKY